MRAYLRDYAAMMEAVPFPSFLHDRRWDVALANSAFDALFEGIRPHPTAMPRRNFLRFVLFHPDARNVLAEHETSWCLPMLAGFAEEMKSDTGSRDRALQAIRREIARDPIMEAAYCDGLPRWVRSVGTAAAHCDGDVRPLRHPDSRWGRTDCRLVSETPKALDGMGLSRVTLVLT
ncbi:hypothetical protein [Streptomyces sp. GC420]|uniref:MmyB family transcriptional regulator n=1 Tax=Streptomyces sp. GC420 TaxID=2697568 RepID=UPI0014150BFA|nr:hypothetical protein [Streptomyces sp. GC420]